MTMEPMSVMSAKHGNPSLSFIQKGAENRTRNASKQYTIFLPGGMPEPGRHGLFFLSQATPTEKSPLMKYAILQAMKHPTHAIPSLRRACLGIALLLAAMLGGCWMSGSIHDAAKNGRKDLVQRWLALGNNVDERDLKGATPLHFAAEGGHIDILEMLLTKGANPNARNEIGNTPLHEAAWKGQTAAANLLMRRGADPSAKAIDGKTPAQLALKAGFPECAAAIAASPTPEH